jgi:hypothetical protein
LVPEHGATAAFKIKFQGTGADKGIVTVDGQISFQPFAFVPLSESQDSLTRAVS